MLRDKIERKNKLKKKQGLNLEEKRNEIKCWETKLKDKKQIKKVVKKDNQGNEYHIWHKNRTKSNENDKI